MASVLEILRATPRTNCGECGYPACMAFAAALSSGKARPGDCPYLPQEFHEARTVSGDPGPAPPVWETTLLRELRAKVRGVDLASRAEGLGASLAVDRGGQVVLEFLYLGRTVRLSGRCAGHTGGGELDPRDQILLYNYLFFNGSGPLSGQWVGLESLPGSMSKAVTLRRYTEERLASAFQGNPVSLRNACAGVGARPIIPCHGDLCMEIPVLPQMPVQLHFWDADPDEGFPARVKVLFDARVLDFLDMESVVFAAERLAERLEELADR